MSNLVLFNAENSSVLNVSDKHKSWNFIILVRPFVEVSP